MSTPRRTAFISSTAIDLPGHRAKVTRACLERGLFPDGMEQWPAQDAGALDACLAKVDAADVFIGVYGHRYGWVPPGQQRSITELEYDRAVARGIPRLLFVMGDDHPVRAADVEKGAGAERLEAFKTRIGSERVWATFDSAEQLHTRVVNALAEHAAAPVAGDHDDRVEVYISREFPRASEHFLGRERELALLDDAWDDLDGTHLVQLVAAGGTGKTTLVNRRRNRLARTAGAAPSGCSAGASTARAPAKTARPRKTTSSPRRWPGSGSTSSPPPTPGKKVGA